MKVLITIVSSNKNEVTRAILNSFIQKLHNHKLAQNAYKRIKIKNAPKKHVKGKQSLIRLFAFLCFCPSVLYRLVAFNTFSAFQCVPNLFVKNKNYLNNLIYITTLDLPLYQKKFVPRRFSCKYIRIFSASSTRSNVSSLFVKIATSFKRWYNVDFFLKIFFSRQLISGTCSKSICWLSQSYSLYNVGLQLY